MHQKTFYCSRPDAVAVAPIPGGAVAYLRENIEEVPAPDGGTQYSADEYTVFSAHSEGNLLKKVTEDFDKWLGYAKEQEALDGGDDLDNLDLLEIAADHEERLCMLELGV